MPAEPARLLGLTQQGADMPLTAKTAARQLCHADLLWRTGRGLPQSLVLIKSIKLAHRKPGTIMSIYSVLLPYIPGNTVAQVTSSHFWSSHGAAGGI